MNARKIIAVAYTVFAIAAFLIGWISNSGPLNYIFFVIAGLPWTLLFNWILGDSVSSPLIPLAAVLINAALLWWWALRKR